jgi:hypothetical protein
MSFHLRVSPYFAPDAPYREPRMSSEFRRRQTMRAALRTTFVAARAAATIVGTVGIVAGVVAAVFMFF